MNQFATAEKAFSHIFFQALLQFIRNPSKNTYNRVSAHSLKPFKHYGNLIDLFI